MKRTRVAVAATVIVGGLLATFPPTAFANAGTNAEASVSATREKKLLVRYDTTKPCTVYLNYPKNGIVGNGHPFTVPVGKERVIWRYNVNRDWAVVSDPVRARNKDFPWWGFTRQDCIAGEPRRVREGRSAVTRSGWRPVKFSMPPAPVTSRHQEVRHNGTLRDPANFVVGNVPSGWHVDVTAKTRSNGSWVYVYVPSAKRWGYIEGSKLS